MVGCSTCSLIRLNEPPVCLEDDEPARARPRLRLQSVLDSMKPFPLFDPSTVPRPNPSDAWKDSRFQDQGGYVVIEAEQLPIPRDESWCGEANVTGYRGLGYLRSLRDQTIHDGGSSSVTGQTHVGVIVDNAGPWRIAVRCRSDHAAGSERMLWFKADGGDWLAVSIPQEVEPGNWTWVDPLSSGSSAAQAAQTVALPERGNDFWIAPGSANLKIDRIVIYQEDESVTSTRPANTRLRVPSLGQPLTGGTVGESLRDS